MHLVEDSAVARGMIRVDPGEDVITALEALATAAGWRDAFVTGSGSFELVEIARGVETMTLERAQLVHLSGRIVKRPERCDATLFASLHAGGQLHTGRIVAAIAGELLLIVDAALAAPVRARPAAAAAAAAVAPEPRQKSPEPKSPEPPPSESDVRAAIKPPSQTFTAKPVIVPRNPADSQAPEDEGYWMDVEAGDVLEHPQLGSCEVVGEDESGGMRVRIASGRVCVLRLDTLMIAEAATKDAGARVFKVEGPRRRR